MSKDYFNIDSADRVADKITRPYDAFKSYMETYKAAISSISYNDTLSESVNSLVRSVQDLYKVYDISNNSVLANMQSLVHSVSEAVSATSALHLQSVLDVFRDIDYSSLASIEAATHIIETIPDDITVDTVSELVENGKITDEDLQAELKSTITGIENESAKSKPRLIQKALKFVAIQLILFLIAAVFSPVTDKVKEELVETFRTDEFWQSTGIIDWIDSWSNDNHTATEDEAKATVDESKTGNISKQKREDLLSKVKEIRNFISNAPQDENTGNLLSYLSEIEKDINGKKYGLVFEEHREDIDEVLETHTSVLTEETDLFIDNGGQMNFLIEGDNLASLKLLKKTHKGQIDLIYIDPPYNTGKKDFIYDDNYVNTDDSFKHSKWLSFMYKRLEIAKEVLKSDGCIFISIDNNEFAQLKILCDSVFGENAFVTVLHVEMSATQGMKVKAAKQGNIVKNGEHILVYKMDGTKNVGVTPLLDPVRYDAHYNSFLINEGEYYSEKPLSEIISKHSEIINALRLLGLLDRKDKLPNKNISAAYEKCDSFREWVNSNSSQICRTHDTITIDDETKKSLVVNRVYPYSSDSRDYLICKNEKGEVFQRILLSDKLSIADDFYSTYGPTRIRGDWWAGFYLDMGNITKEGNVGFSNGKKPVRLIKQIIKFALKSKTGIILDFFAGSGTTGQSVMELNNEDNGSRKYILCTNNENNICRRVTYKRIKGIVDSNNFNSSLKYYKVEFVPINERLYYEYADELLLHIRELVELENGINFIDNSEIAIVLTDEELDNFTQNIEQYSACRKLYMGHDLLPDEDQERIIEENNIEINIIPDYYYRDLQEA